MRRPLIQLGVGKLEELFSKSKSDPKALKQLEHELQFRQVPRAVGLLSDVQAALRNPVGVAKLSAASTVAAPAFSPPLLSSGGKAPFPVHPSIEHMEAKSLVKSAPVAIPTPSSTEAAPEKPERLPEPGMTLDEAYRELKAAPEDGWEAIELLRQRLVRQASPYNTRSLSAEKRAQLLEQADQANAAYLTIARARRSG